MNAKSASEIGHVNEPLKGVENYGALEWHLIFE
jgi:hypothetical protein